MQEIKKELVSLHEDATTLNALIEGLDGASEHDIAFAHSFIEKVEAELKEARKQLELVPFDEEEMERIFFPNQIEASVDV